MPSENLSIEYKTTHSFRCLTCEEQFGEMPIYSREEIIAHLKNFHRLTTLKGDRRAVCYLDGSGWFQQDYNWTIGDIRLYYSVRGERIKR